MCMASMPPVCWRSRRRDDKSHGTIVTHRRIMSCEKMNINKRMEKERERESVNERMRMIVRERERE